MTAYEIIEIFETEMMNQIFHHVSDDVLQEILIDSIKEVSKMVTETYEARKNEPKEQ